ncbi:MAG: Hsp20/alpha crystallin family protein [Halobacteriaceae archaeon]
MRRHPFREFESWFEEFPELGGVAETAVDVAESEEEFTITMDLPGFEREDISVRLTDHTLHVEAEAASEREEEKEFLRRERTRRSVARTIQLPPEVEPDEAEASYHNGVLTVAIPKQTAAESEARRVPIS